MRTSAFQQKLDKIDMSKEKKEVRNHLKRCVIVNGLIKCKIKLLNLQYFDAQGHKFILLKVEVDNPHLVFGKNVER